MGSEAPIKTIPLIIDNKPVVPPSSKIVTNPSANTKADYVKYVSASPEDAIAAAESSQAAFKAWSQTLPRVRRNILQKTAALMRENTAELIKLQMEETNCPEYWAVFNVTLAALHLEEIASRITTALEGAIPVVQNPGQMAFVHKRPMGPVLSIVPWNGAIVLATRAIDTPLAVGCPVLFKVSELSPNTHHFLAELFRRAGLPPGVLNVIQTRREDSAAVTEALISHKAIRKIEFIGSAAVGSHIGALSGKYLKPVIMELGGKAASLVLEDADLEHAAQAAVQGGFMHHGQICFSTERIIVHKAVADKYIALLKEKAAKFPQAEAISPANANKAHGMVQDAISKGATIVYGEAKLIHESKLHPIILTDMKPNMEVYDNESFGPVLNLYVVNSDEEAIELCNNTKYGLSAAVWSQNITKALKVASQLEVGQTHINYPMGTGSDEATVGIGLSKGSGWTKQNANFGMDEFLEVRNITVSEPAEFLAGVAAAQAQARAPQ